MRKTYAVLNQRIHGIRYVTVRASQPRIYVEYRVHDHRGPVAEECKTMGAAVHLAQNLLDNFAKARIIWERP